MKPSWWLLYGLTNHIYFAAHVKALLFYVTEMCYTSKRKQELQDARKTKVQKIGESSKEKSQESSVILFWKIWNKSIHRSNYPVPPLLSTLQKMPDLCIYHNIQKTRILLQIEVDQEAFLWSDGPTTTSKKFR